MMIGIIMLGVLECIHGTKFPFKDKATNDQELFWLLNIHFFLCQFSIHCFKFYCSKIIYKLVQLWFSLQALWFNYQLLLHRRLKVAIFISSIRTEVFCKLFHYNTTCKPGRLTITHYNTCRSCLQLQGVPRTSAYIVLWMNKCIIGTMWYDLHWIPANIHS